MTPRLATLPVTDAAMWRRILARAHPDAGGGHDLFIWAQGVREQVCGELDPPQYPPPPSVDYSTQNESVPFDPTVGFTVLTARALAVAVEGAEPYATLLRLLGDCEEAGEGSLTRQQQKGATYKQLAAIAHTVGLGKQARSEWYRVAESIPLSRRHAGHILSKLKEVR